MASDHVLTVTAVMPTGTPSQTTRYVYGVTTGAGGSAIASNDLLAALEYPDPATGSASSSPANRKSYTYDALGELTTLTDPNGTVHSYSYDLLGRPTSDAITTLGTGVDGTVRRLETAYNSAGQASLFTSYDAPSGGTILNQVERVFNGLGQLTGEYQEHHGAVNTATTPETQYTYTEMAGGQNNSRPLSMIYPNGRVVDDTYNSGLDDAISRVSALADDSGGMSSTVLEAYSYLGLNTIVQRARPEIGVNLSYLLQDGDTAAHADGGDQYTGLDRFGRVIDQNWVDTSAGTGTSTDRFQYGYDRDGNRLYQADLVDAALSALYHASSGAAGDDNTAYDPLGRLTGFVRGILSSSGNNGSALDTVASPSRSQSWQLDALGNWTSQSSDGTTTTRTFNAQDQTTGDSRGAAPAYDANGNTTADNGQVVTYDAWNRPTVVAAAGATLAQYRYDALGRRIAETTVAGTATPAATEEHGLTATYYDNSDLTGTSVTQVDSTVDFNWGTGSPVDGHRRRQLQRRLDRRRAPRVHPDLHLLHPERRRGEALGRRRVADRRLDRPRGDRALEHDRPGGGPAIHTASGVLRRHRVGVGAPALEQRVDRQGDHPRGPALRRLDGGLRDARSDGDVLRQQRPERHLGHPRRPDHRLPLGRRLAGRGHRRRQLQRRLDRRRAPRVHPDLHLLHPERRRGEALDRRPVADRRLDRAPGDGALEHDRAGGGPAVHGASGVLRRHGGGLGAPALEQRVDRQGDHPPEPALRRLQIDRPRGARPDGDVLR